MKWNCFTCSIYSRKDKKYSCISYHTSPVKPCMFRYYPGHGLSQWEKVLLCNAFSHRPSPCPEWSLRLLRFTLTEDKNITISCTKWWPGDARTQGISSHGIDLVLQEQFGLGPRVFTLLYWHQISKCVVIAGLKDVVAIPKIKLHIIERLRETELKRWKVWIVISIRDS